MDVIVLESQAYYRLLEELDQKIKKAVAEALKKNEDDWVDGDEAKQLLKIKSKSKLQSLRDNGEITFSQHGRIILYYRPSILEFLKKHVVKF